MTFAIVLLFFGLVFLVAEIFFTSFGLFGILSAACLVGGIVVGFEQSRGQGLALLAVTLVLAPAVVAFAIKALPKTPFGRKLILDAAPSETRSAATGTEHGEVKPGDTGVASTLLRPSGIAEIGGRRVDVVTRGEMVVVGAPLRVTNVSGNRIVVEPLPPGEAP